MTKEDMTNNPTSIIVMGLLIFLTAGVFLTCVFSGMYNTLSKKTVGCQWNNQIKRRMAVIKAADLKSVFISRLVASISSAALVILSLSRVLTLSSVHFSPSKFCFHSKYETVTPPELAKTSGITVTFFLKNISSAWGVVGPLAISKIILALTCPAFSEVSWFSKAAGTKISTGNSNISLLVIFAPHPFKVAFSFLHFKTEQASLTGCGANITNKELLELPVDIL